MSNHGKNHWIKLYIEMNHDPKIGLLTDDLKWRFVSVLLLAGEVDDGGFLPEINDMAWQLHAVPETVAGQMRTLAQRGLVELRQHPEGDERWFVSKFADRQAPSTNAERQSQWRKRNTNNEPVTNRYAKVTPETETETETEYRSREGEKSGAIAPAPTPAAFQPVPEPIKHQKARKGIQEPNPATTAPAALRLLHELTAYWPGEDNAPLIIASIGDNPDRSALARAVELWRASGHKINNWLGICDWYHEVSRDPDWTPQTRFKPRPNGSSPTGPTLSPAEQAAERYVAAKRAVLGDNP